jgi:hypothetical protein
MLDGEEMSLRLDRRLGESELNVAGRSRGPVEYVALELLCCRARASGRLVLAWFPLSGLGGKLSGASRLRGLKGLENIGVVLPSATAGFFLDRMNEAQSWRLLWWSSGGVRNHRVLVPASLLAINPTDRLERRFRSLSLMVTTSVGWIGPCFR